MGADRGDITSPLAVPAIASAAAAVLHATAAGVHADQPTLSRIFVVTAVLQAAAAVAGFLTRNRSAAIALAAVNIAALAGWSVTRISGISWIDGLEAAEQPGLADTISALFAAVAAIASVWALSTRTIRLPNAAVLNAAVLAGVLIIPGLADATNHEHGDREHAAGEAEGEAHDHTDTAGATGATAAGDVLADGHEHPAGTTEAAADASADDHTHSDDASTGGEHSHEASETSVDESAATSDRAWPWPWDPATTPIDFAGVPGVSAEQQRRAEQLVSDTLRELPAFADVTSVGALGYQSIGDASSGFEHYVNYSKIVDDRFLDPAAPESLVYAVDGDRRTLVSAMFIANQMPIDDAQLVDFGGPLMQWHVHDNLCWGLDENSQPKVQHVLTEPGETCPALTINAGAENPMVHVWITPHECGPFAALEGHGAGQVDPATGQRADQCAHDHAADASGHEHTGDVTTSPYDPTLPIDLGGVAGVTPQQQAFAENLVAATVRDLPDWSDLDVVEAAGFHSIQDGATGHEHYIQWDWIEDDVWLDPRHPESLVFEPQPDGSKRLVSAMFMLPSSMTLDDVPDWGGALMQWHVHGDLCFTDDPVAPIVAGTKPLGGSCRAPLVDFPLSPMIHVWITPTPCGPFAALDGIAAGQVPDGEAALCDHAHGSA